MSVWISHDRSRVIPACPLRGRLLRFQLATSLLTSLPGWRCRLGWRRRGLRHRRDWLAFRSGRCFRTPPQLAIELATPADKPNQAGAYEAADSENLAPVRVNQDSAESTSGAPT